MKRINKVSLEAISVSFGSDVKSDDKLRITQAIQDKLIEWFDVSRYTVINNTESCIGKATLNISAILNQAYFEGDLKDPDYNEYHDLDVIPRLIDDCISLEDRKLTRIISADFFVNNAPSNYFTAQIELPELARTGEGGGVTVQGSPNIEDKKLLKKVIKKTLIKLYQHDLIYGAYAGFKEKREDTEEVDTTEREEKILLTDVLEYIGNINNRTVLDLVSSKVMANPLKEAPKKQKLTTEDVVQYISNEDFGMLDIVRISLAIKNKAAKRVIAGKIKKGDTDGDGIRGVKYEPLNNEGRGRLEDRAISIFADNDGADPIKLIKKSIMENSMFNKVTVEDINELIKNSVHFNKCDSPVSGKTVVNVRDLISPVTAMALKHRSVNYEPRIVKIPVEILKDYLAGKEQEQDKDDNSIEFVVSSVVGNGPFSTPVIGSSKQLSMDETKELYKLYSSFEGKTNEEITNKLKEAFEGDEDGKYKTVLVKFMG